MCGRTAFQMHPVQIPAAAGVPPQRANLNGYRPSHNVPPGRNQPVLFRKDDASSAGSASGTDCLPTASACASAASGGTVRSLMCMKWGLIPHWTKGAVSYQSLMRTSNARSETVHELPSFRSLVHKRRCVVLAEGFFEWLQEGGPKGGKKPFYMTPKDPARSLLMFAGLYDIHKGDDGELTHSYTILTCPVSGELAWLHSRMPCILTSEADVDRWLSRDPYDSVRSLLQPVTGALKWTAVSTVVNSVQNDSPECIAPSKDDCTKRRKISAFFVRTSSPTSSVTQQPSGEPQDTKATTGQKRKIRDEEEPILIE